MLECARWRVENELGVVDPCFNCKIKESDCPTYTDKKEEQQEHAKEKENRCYNESCERNNKNGECNSNLPNLKEFCMSKDIKQPKPINYEEEYNKLKKENEQYKACNKLLIDDNKAYHIENEKLISDMVGTSEEKGKLEQEINHLNYLIEKKDIKIEKLEKEIENWCNLETKDTKEVNRLNAENNKLTFQYEEAKYCIERLEKQAEETKEKLENYILLKRMMEVLIKGL